MKSIIKFMIASSMIVGGALVIGTIFTTKKIDQFGDKLQKRIH